jgi:GDP/UDP-N,N'-diacetylbacillosamine 2-epimerase (hydrolysing)
MRKIAVVTGTRAEYGILKPVMEAIKSEPELELSIIVTGMHLLQEFGNTAQEIENDGFEAYARVDMLSENDTPAAMAESVGRGIIGMAGVWEKLKPDVILVLGDRAEALAGAVSGAYMNIPVAHIHGGDACTGGNIDDSNRYAITKFAHIHFPATEKSKKRIEKLGEDPGHIHMTGSPAIDGIKRENTLTDKETAGRFNLNLNKPLVLVIQHPVTTQFDMAAEQMRRTLEAVKETGYQAIVIYPNADAGGREMIKVIKEYENLPPISAYSSLPRREYLSLMKVAGVLVGNSSSGIIDASYLKLPAVNIGIRQEGRERGDNIIDVEHDKSAIMEAIDKALSDKNFREKVKNGKSPYGNGDASPEIVRILKELEINTELLQKKITY